VECLKIGVERVRTDRIRILDAGFYGQKLKKIDSKMTKLLEQPVILHREDPALKNMKYLFLFFVSFFGLS
jgi:hypothetical protein